MRRARDALFDHFDVGDARFGWSRWRGQCETPNLRVRMFTQRWHIREGTGLLAGDTIFVAFSAGFVWLYLALHFRSLILATLGMLQILMSLPLALLFYPFRFIREHLIAVFLSLGVGADDLFVFYDTWRQSRELPRAISGSLELRFAWTFNRAALAMLTTTTTTAICLGATAASSCFNSLASAGKSSPDTWRR